MREIKFRAWNGSKMLDNIGLHPFMIFRLSDNGLCEEGEYDDNSGDLVVTNSAYNVMQYTGLKDKNGVDIYESDLLINPKKEIGIVEWDEAGFHLRCERKNNSIFLIPLTHGFLLNKQIIGNIHQNPELL